MEEPGRYIGVCQSMKLTTSMGGKPYFDIQFKITQRAGDGEWIDIEEPYDRGVRVYLTKPAEPQSFAILQNIGFNGDFDNPCITNEYLELMCRHQNYNGRTSERWEFPRLARAAPPDDLVIADLRERWRQVTEQL